MTLLQVLFFAPMLVVSVLGMGLLVYSEVAFRRGYLDERYGVEEAAGLGAVMLVIGVIGALVVMLLSAIEGGEAITTFEVLLAAAMIIIGYIGGRKEIFNGWPYWLIVLGLAILIF